MDLPWLILLGEHGEPSDNITDYKAYVEHLLKLKYT